MIGFQPVAFLLIQPIKKLDCVGMQAGSDRLEAYRTLG